MLLTVYLKKAFLSAGITFSVMFYFWNPEEHMSWMLPIATFLIGIIFTAGLILGGFRKDLEHLKELAADARRELASVPELRSDMDDCKERLDKLRLPTVRGRRNEFN